MTSFISSHSYIISVYAGDFKGELLEEIYN